MNKRTADYLCILVAIIWGGGFIATSAALETFAPFIILFIRFTGAALVSMLFLLARGKRISKKSLYKGSVCGLFLYIAFAFQTFGLQYSDTGSNAFLTSVNVVLVPYFSWFLFKKKPPKVIFAASLICLAGIGCLSFSNGIQQFRFGDILTLICAVFFALQIIATQWATKDEEPATINGIQLCTAAILSVPFAFYKQAWPSNISITAVGSCLYLILVSTWLAYEIQTLAQKYTDSSSASLLLGTESLWANVFGAVLLKEQKSPLMIFGGCLIFLSILIVEGSDQIAEKMNIRKTAKAE